MKLNVAWFYSALLVGLATNIVNANNQQRRNEYEVIQELDEETTPRRLQGGRRGGGGGRGGRGRGGGRGGGDGGGDDQTVELLVLVNGSEGKGKTEEVARGVDGHVRHAADFHHHRHKEILVASVPRSSVAETVAELKSQPGVELVEENDMVFPIQAIDYGIEMAQGGTFHPYPDVDPGTSDACSSDESFKVAIIDSGLEALHAASPCHDIDDPSVSNCVGIELLDNPLPGETWHSPAANNGHGTHVFGTIGALSQNPTGIDFSMLDSSTGICYLIAKVFGDGGGGATNDKVFAAVDWARRNGARVINMSLGGPTNSSIGQRYFDDVRSDGGITVAAAGNDGNSAYSFPASYDEVISVAAVDWNEDRASFSQYNDQVDIAAPGVRIPSMYTGGIYVYSSGTSMASPHVTGAIARIWSICGDSCTGTEVETCTLSTAKDISDAGSVPNAFGNGLVQAWEAYQCLLSTCCVTTSNTSPSAAPSNAPTGTPSQPPSTTSIPSSVPTTLASTVPSSQPTRAPSAVPSSQPTRAPSAVPSSRPTPQASEVPTALPSAPPSASAVPSVSPSRAPSAFPTSRPSASVFPTTSPTVVPTPDTSATPTSSAGPSSAPTTGAPSAVPTPVASIRPTSSRAPSSIPTKRASASPSGQPTQAVSSPPSSAPSKQPSAAPSPLQSTLPTASGAPSVVPTPLPSSSPSHGPIVHPSASPSPAPSVAPSNQPSMAASFPPSRAPSKLPSVAPSPQESFVPTSSGMPSLDPTSTPSVSPSNAPTVTISAMPSGRPTANPSTAPSGAASNEPTNSLSPTSTPTTFLSTRPSSLPTKAPSSPPSGVPSTSPSRSPIVQVSTSPTSSIAPSSSPSAAGTTPMSDKCHSCVRILNHAVNASRNWKQCRHKCKRAAKVAANGDKKDIIFRNCNRMCRALERTGNRYNVPYYELRRVCHHTRPRPICTRSNNRRRDDHSED